MENNLARSRFRGKNAFENAKRKLENFVYRSVLFDDRHFSKKVQISKVEMKNGFFFFFFITVMKLLRVSRCNIILAVNIG